MPRLILAEAKFGTWDGAIEYGTVYEICEVKDNEAHYEFMFYNDLGQKEYTKYFKHPLWEEYNHDMYQFYFIF